MKPMTPTLPELLRGWLPAQRWYPAKGAPVSLRRVGGIHLHDPDGAVGLEVHLVAVDSGERVDVINVPLSYRSAPLDGAEAGLVGETEYTVDGSAAPRWVYDGAYDPVFVTAWLEMMRGGSTTADGRATGHAVEPFAGSAPRSTPASMQVLTGEQSNTSVIIDDGELPSIVKFFRVLGPGPNPDVEVGAGLTSAGCTQVPATYGWVSGYWHDPAGEFVDGRPSGALVEGQLSVLREFIDGSEDAWRQACRAALNGDDYTGQAFGLGRATAGVHLSLSMAFGTRTATEAERSLFIESIVDRIDWAWAEAGPAVGEGYAALLQGHIDALRNEQQLPDLQRIHGDYHLGQVLYAPHRGWAVLDFEGEPLRTAAERSQADVPLRDVVGMLRSFDYVAGVVMHGDSGAASGGGHDDGRRQRAEQARHWAAACSRAFIDGYQQETGRKLETNSPLFVALWLDKALYEVVYERRNRPDWLPVPVAGVRKALDDRSSGAGSSTAGSSTDGRPSEGDREL